MKKTGTSLLNAGFFWSYCNDLFTYFLYDLYKKFTSKITGHLSHWKLFFKIIIVVSFRPNNEKKKKQKELFLEDYEEIGKANKCLKNKADNNNVKLEVKQLVLQNYGEYDHSRLQFIQNIAVL